MRVTVLGTSTMGSGMARSLLRGGHAVTVWNRTPAKAQALAEAGASVAETPQEAVADAEVVLTMLFDADSVLAVMDEAAGGFPPEAIWLQTSTVGLDGIARIAALAAERGWALIDAPVLGTKTPAEEGKLAVLASGDELTLQRARPVLDVIGSKTVRVGERIGQASALKLVANSWVTALTASVAQAISLSEALGLDPTLFLEALAGGAVDSPYAHVKGKAMIAGEFPASFALDGARKDLDLIADAADQARMSVELIEAVRTLYRRASGLGHGDDDLAAVVTAFR